MRLNKTNLYDGSFDFVDKGELPELYLDHVLEYTESLSLYAQAVMLGGTIEILSSDFDLIVDKYSRHLYYIDKMNEYLMQDRKFLVSLEPTVKHLQQMGFEIITKRLDPENDTFYIKAQRTR